MATVTITFQTGTFPVECWDDNLFNPAKSILAGGNLSNATMQSFLAGLQQVYLQLSMGQSVVVAEYSQGPGSTKKVTYKHTDITTISGAIMLLQSQLGVVRRVRRPIGFSCR
jgi:hypothetical protein